MLGHFWDNSIGINLYGFVDNNPVNLIDPYGLKDWGKIIGGGAIVAFSIVEAGVGGALIGIGIIEMPAGALAGPAGLAISIPVGIHTMGLGGLLWANAVYIGNIGAEIFIEGWNDTCNGK